MSFIKAKVKNMMNTDYIFIQGNNILTKIVNNVYIFIHGNNIHDEIVGSQTVTH